MVNEHGVDAQYEAAVADGALTFEGPDARPTTNPEAPLSRMVRHPLAYLEAVAEQGIRSNRPSGYGKEVAEVLERCSDDDLVEAYAGALAIIEERVAALRWVSDIAKVEITKRLVARRAERGGDSEIAIPHPTIEVKCEAQFAPYVFDVDALETILPQLSEDDQKKLLRIEPEHVVPEQIIPAHVVPRRVSAGSTASILGIARKYAGSMAAAVIEHATSHQRLADKITIRPKPPTQKRVVPE
jgi:hypothetical protein